MAERFKWFDRLWFITFVALTMWSAFQSYTGFTLAWFLLAINNLFDAYVGVGLSNGIKRYFYLLLFISSCITIFVKTQLGLYGSAVSGAVGAIYSLLGYLQYKGEITATTKQDTKSIVFNGLLGMVLFVALYYLDGEQAQNSWLIFGNFMVFTIGLVGRYLLSQGKDLAYAFWILYDITTFTVEFSVYLISGNASILIVLVSTTMLFIIDTKTFFVWRHLARQAKTTN